MEIDAPAPVIVVPPMISLATPPAIEERDRQAARAVAQAAGLDPSPAAIEQAAAIAAEQRTKAAPARKSKSKSAKKAAAVENEPGGRGAGEAAGAQEAQGRENEPAGGVGSLGRTGLPQRARKAVQPEVRRRHAGGVSLATKRRKLGRRQAQAQSPPESSGDFAPEQNWNIFLTTYAGYGIVTYSGDGAGGDEAPAGRSGFPHYPAFLRAFAERAPALASPRLAFHSSVPAAFRCAPPRPDRSRRPRALPGQPADKELVRDLPP